MAEAADSQEYCFGKGSNVFSPALFRVRMYSISRPLVCRCRLETFVEMESDLLITEPVSPAVQHTWCLNSG